MVPRCSVSATSARVRPCRSWRARPRCSSGSATSTPGRSASTPRTSTRSSAPSSSSPPASAGSTSRTSPHRGVSRSRRGCGTSSTSRSSTTTSTGRRSSRWRRCATRCGRWTRSSATRRWAWPGAARRNALRVVDKQLRDVKVVVAGGGAAGTAIVSLLLEAGVGSVLVWDREGILSPDDERLSGAKLELARRTNPAGERGELPDALVGADVFIGVSAGNVLPVEALAGMKERAVVFPMANPTPEVDPVRARQYAAVVASGRSDLPNQINNVLAFPGVFRGLLDARATEITDGMLLAAADALAAVVRDDQLNANYIIPSVFDPAVTQAVAAAVAAAARAEPGATFALSGEPGASA